MAGGSGALGRSVTKAFVRAGARVAVPYIVDEEVPLLKSTLKHSMTKVFLHKADLFKEDEVKDALGVCERRLGRIDFLVNLVGGYFGGTTVAETEEKDWDNMMRLNLKATFLLCRTVLPRMVSRRYGRIVNMASESGLRGEATLGAYSVSKSGVIRLTETIAEEFREYDITANAVLPRIIDTPANRQAMSDADFSRWPKPEEIARVILFLSSDDAKLVSGGAIPGFSHLTTRSSSAAGPFQSMERLEGGKRGRERRIVPLPHGPFTAHR